MRRNTLKPFILVLALAGLVTPAFAKSVVKIIMIAGPQSVAGIQLKNNDYTFRVDDTKLVVELHHKVVAEATGHWEPRPEKYHADMLVSTDAGQIQELRFAGEKQAFVPGSK
jgi:hypothetical protein